MKVRSLTTTRRFAVLFLFAGAFACGDPEVEPDPNRPPAAVGTIPPLSLVEGQTETVDVSIFFSDPDGDQLSYSASSSDNSVLTVSVSGSNVTANAVAKGLVQVTVTATDPDGASASHMVDVTVEAPNQEPVVTDTIPAQSIRKGDTVTIDAADHFSDPDGDELTYAAASSNTDAATAGHEGSMVTIIAVAKGSATVTVTATDPENASASQEVEVTVKAANRAPRRTRKIQDRDMAPGDTVTFDAANHFTDPDGDTLTFTAEAGGASVASVSVDGSIVTIVAHATGATLMTVTATDPGELSASQKFIVSVTQGNQGPETRAPGCAAAWMTRGGGHRRLPQ
ncbi:MAG: hypothetical protein F4Y21_08540 [Gemmatimonadetes bacterium]|nr:hypothetical protein [Gemmatimonadota bacterium]